MTHYTTISNKGGESRKSCLGGREGGNEPSVYQVPGLILAPPPAKVSLISNAEIEKLCLEGVRSEQK